MLPRITGEFTIGSDPELRFTQIGKAVASFSAVASKSKKDDAGNWVDDKDIWVRVTVWDRVAEHVAESFTKGSRIVLSGTIHEEKWTDKDGNDRKTLNVTADEIGASIRFGSTVYTKAERASAAGPVGADNPWATAPQTHQPPF